MEGKRMNNCRNWIRRIREKKCLRKLRGLCRVRNNYFSHYPSCFVAVTLDVRIESTLEWCGEHDVNRSKRKPYPHRNYEKSDRPRWRVVIKVRCKFFKEPRWLKNSYEALATLDQFRSLHILFSLTNNRLHLEGIENFSEFSQNSMTLVNKT